MSKENIAKETGSSNETRPLRRKDGPRRRPVPLSDPPRPHESTPRSSRRPARHTVRPLSERTFHSQDVQSPSKIPTSAPTQANGASQEMDEIVQIPVQPMEQPENVPEEESLKKEKDSKENSPEDEALGSDPGAEQSDSVFKDSPLKTDQNETDALFLSEETVSREKSDSFHGQEEENQPNPACDQKEQDLVAPSPSLASDTPRAFPDSQNSAFKEGQEESQKQEDKLPEEDFSLAFSEEKAKDKDTDGDRMAETVPKKAEEDQPAQTAFMEEKAVCELEEEKVEGTERPNAKAAEMASPFDSSNPEDSASSQQATVAKQDEGAASLQADQEHPTESESSKPVPADGQPGSEFEPDPELVQKILKKNERIHKLIRLVTGLLIALIVAGTIGAMIRLQPAPAPNTPVEKDYLVLSSCSVLEEPVSGKVNGKLQPGQDVYILESMTSDNGETWGKISDIQWVKLADSEYTYLIAQDAVHISAAPENKSYEALQDVNVYTIPGAISEPVSKIKQGTEVYILETTMTRDKTVWGRTGVDQWVLLEKDGTPYLRLIEEEEEKPTEEEKKEDEEEAVKTTQTTEEGDSMDGFETGIYQLDYDMIIRRDPSYDSPEVKVLEKGTLVRIAWFQKNEERRSIWGELDNKGSGYWICLEDSAFTYVTYEDKREPVSSDRDFSTPLEEQPDDLQPETSQENPDPQPESEDSSQNNSSEEKSGENSQGEEASVVDLPFASLGFSWKERFW